MTVDGVRALAAAGLTLAGYARYMIFLALLPAVELEDEARRQIGAQAALIEQAIADHRRIVAALRSRDADAAEAAVRDHCHNGRDRMRVAL